MANRLNTLKSHFDTRFPSLAPSTSLDEFRQRSVQFSSESLKKLYFKRVHTLIEKYREHFETFSFFNHIPELNQNKEYIRNRSMKRFASSILMPRSTYQKDMEDPWAKMILPYVYSEFDESLVTLCIVHYCLYQDSLESIGTEKHRELIDKSYSLEDLGSFAMTEMGHGSDVSRLETEAVYNHETKEFILNSPTATSAKWWVGGLARNATQTIVFANLIVKSVNHGVHAFVVNIRDENHEVVEGVTLGDCGPKIGQEGIDNGFAIFNEKRIPYDSLLDKFSEISPDGNFKSKIKNKEKRLGLELAGLIRGRICVIFGSEVNLRAGLTIALRYSAVRKQFSEENEKVLLDYQSQQYRLLPILSKMLAMRVAATFFLDEYQKIRNLIQKDPESQEITEYHALLSACKGISSWEAIKGLQTIREACGGHGYSAHSFIGRLRNNQDIQVTWEGDNSVLIEQTSKFLLKQVENKFKGKHVSLASVEFIDINFDQLKEKNSRFESVEELLKEEILIEILEYRCNHLIHNCILKLEEISSQTSSLMDSWNETEIFYLQNLSLAYGELHLARLILEIAGNCEEDLNLAELLKELAFLFIVNIIEQNLALFLEHFFRKEEARIVREAVLYLLSRIAPSSVSFIDALAVPDFLHGSELGRADGQVYEEIIQRVEADPYCYSKAGWFETIKRMRDIGKRIHK